MTTKKKRKTLALDVSTLDFEAAMLELETIVAADLDGTSLTDALQVFERGVLLANRCKALLDETERRVSQLLPEGEVVEFD